MLQGRNRSATVAVTGHYRALAGGDLTVAKDAEIHDRLSRVEEIIEQLDAGECDLDEGKALHEEGQELLAEVREILDEGSGEVVELE